MLEHRSLSQIKEEIEKGKTLVEIGAKFKMSVSSLRHLLKQKGMDYRKIMIERREKRKKDQFEQSLQFARKHGRIPSYKEFETMGIAHTRIGIYINDLKEKGFEQQSFNPLRIDDDELLKDLYRIYKKTRMLPKKKSVMEHSKYSKDTYTNHFGSLEEAVKLMQQHFMKDFKG